MRDILGLKRGLSSPVVRYGTAALAVMSMALLRLSVNGTLGDTSRYLLFIPAVLFASYYCGAGPGILAMALSITFAMTMFSPTRGAPNLGAHAGEVNFLLFVLVSIGTIYFGKRERLTQQKRQEAESQLSALNRELEIRVHDRTAELEAAVNELDGFCYSMSHDLRTPLRAISGNSRILLEDHPELSDKTENKILRIESAANNMSRLVDAMLVYARLATDKMHVEEFDVVKMVLEAATVERKRTYVDFEVHAPDQILIEADARMMQIVVQVLIRNAVLYRSKDRALSIHLAVLTDGFSFSDNGIGFEAKYADRIFGPLERLHRDEIYQGAGMGLALVRRVMSRHSGRVTASSEIGAGSTFEVHFQNH
ncbi:hypothetical protein BH11ARM1_BH11ARM1_01230 [soil metagenome]